LSWWGKLLGGTFGFMLGGPLGAILGASLGHNFDKGLGGLDSGTAGYGQDTFGSASVEQLQSAFFTATFSMMGHLAKSDGQVSQAEIAVAESVMQQMRLNTRQKKVAISLFERGKQADFPAFEVLQQFRAECHRRRNLMQMFMEILIATALADGDMHQAERRMLESTAGALGFSHQEFQAILQRLQASRHMHQQPQNSAMALNDAYKLLGLAKSASDDEVKKAYRRLMSQHHPDKLVAKGLPQEMMDMANQKTMEIKAAYDRIKSSRT